MLVTVTNFIAGRGGRSTYDTMSIEVAHKKPTRASVERQLARLAASPQFKSAPRLTAFLNYVVEEALAGRSEAIKAYSIAVSALGKSEDFDPAHDSTVRVFARQLRFKLLDYYSSDGVDDDLLVTIPIGSYAPTFEYRVVRPQIANLSSYDEGNASANRRFGRRIRIDTPDSAVGSTFWGSLKFELTAAISRYHELSVVEGAVASKGANDAKALSQSTADFVLVGAPLAGGSVSYIGFQLVRESDGVVIWTGQFEEPSDKRSRDFLKRVSAEITVAIAGPTGCISTHDYRHLQEIGPALDVSYRALLHAYHYLGTVARSDHRETYEQTRAALAEDPRNATIWAILAMLHVHEHEYQYLLEEEEVPALAKARRAAMRAVELDQSNPLGWFYLAMVEFAERNLELFKEYGARAMNLHEDHALVAIEYGHHLWLCGNIENGLDLVNSALARHPNPPARYLFAQVHDNMMHGKFDDAKKLIDQIIMPDFFWVSMIKAVIAARLGDREAAREAAGRADELYPGFLGAVAQRKVAWVFPAKFDTNVVEGVRLI